MTRRSIVVVVVVFSAEIVCTDGKDSNGRNKNEGQLEVWHVDRGKRGLLGVKY